MNFIVLGSIAGQTLMITPRYAGQIVRFNGTDTITEAETPVRVYGTGTVEISEGDWDQAGIFDGVYEGDWVPSDVAPTDSLTIERSVNGGVAWEPVIDAADATTLPDWEALSYGDTMYRATAFTTEGATASTTITVQARSSAVWLSGGPSFGVTGRLPYDPAITIAVSRERALMRFAGRTHPVAVSGEGTTRTVAVSGSTTTLDDETASVARLIEIAQLPDRLFLYRDPDGYRIYGQIDQIQLPREGSEPHPDGWNGWWGYSFTLTEAT